jgi:membrane associated rhomboid family serine protease
MNPIPPLTMKLLWVTFGCLILLALPLAIQLRLMMWPLALMDGASGGVLGNFMPWQLVTHPFISSGGQLLMLAMTLYFFGGQMLESSWSRRRYGLFLLACIAVPAVLQLVLTTLVFKLGLTAYSPVSGASGVIYGILFACAYLYPDMRVMLILPPVPMRMKTMVIIFTIIALIAGMLGNRGIGEFVFLGGGMLAAWLHIRYWRGEPPFGRKRPKPPAQKKSNKPNLRIVN